MSEINHLLQECRDLLPASDQAINNKDLLLAALRCYHSQLTLEKVDVQELEDCDLWSFNEELDHCSFEAENYFAEIGKAVKEIEEKKYYE